ncbi:hypothetical protein CEUSTIGMA_g2038.t1 [Chlamydomonas eustigma]|uniref:Cyclic nucleotide-binding domain-containing protein n=1 Tax=Chlamydomonas eustigma TaxID=1157962 RepID=A0A250WVN2_9CHLO|nr:hypothetical protein CEUSTIGMA_g2038.t1 [Chlamydomonas eustigma]|eukprot:GAX74590.1 hypothetical protein CEUSTIGMA_g2038.t1 [Chlamydomonas eustigma]
MYVGHKGVEGCTIKPKSRCEIVFNEFVTCELPKMTEKTNEKIATCFSFGADIEGLLDAITVKQIEQNELFKHELLREVRLEIRNILGALEPLLNAHSRTSAATSTFSLRTSHNLQQHARGPQPSDVGSISEGGIDTGQSIAPLDDHIWSQSRPPKNNYDTSSQYRSRETSGNGAAPRNSTSGQLDEWTSAAPRSSRTMSGSGFRDGNSAAPGSHTNARAVVGKKIKTFKDIVSMATSRVKKAAHIHQQDFEDQHSSRRPVVMGKSFSADGPAVRVHPISDASKGGDTKAATTDANQFDFSDPSARIAAQHLATSNQQFTKSSLRDNNKTSSIDHQGEGIDPAISVSKKSVTLRVQDSEPDAEVFQKGLNSQPISQSSSGALEPAEPHPRTSISDSSWLKVGSWKEAQQNSAPVFLSALPSTTPEAPTATLAAPHLAFLPGTQQALSSLNPLSAPRNGHVSPGVVSTNLEQLSGADNNGRMFGKPSWFQKGSRVVPLTSATSPGYPSVQESGMKSLAVDGTMSLSYTDRTDSRWLEPTIQGSAKSVLKTMVTSSGKGFAFPVPHGNGFVKVRSHEGTGSATLMLKKLPPLFALWEPNSLWRVIVDYFLMASMVYIILFTPYYIAFGIDTTVLSTPAGAMDLIVTFAFFAEILLNFNTCYPDHDGRLIKDRKRIALNYLSMWFWLDVVSSLPWALILEGSNAGKGLRLLRLMRLIRLFRVIKIAKSLSKANIRNFMQMLDESLGRSAMRMMKLLLLAGTMLHWAACAFYYSASWDDFGPNTWVYHQNLVPNNDTGREVGAAFTERYVYSLYWAIVSMATVGYGDIVPVNVSEKITTIVIILAGATLFAYFMGSMASMIAAEESSAAKMARKRAAVDEFLKQRDVPKRLSNKVRDYYNYCVARTIHVDEAEIIAGLSVGLRMQVVMHLYREALERVPLFQGKPPQFITSLVTYLKLEYYSPGDIVVRQGEVGPEMYFISEGTLEVRVYDQDLANVRMDFGAMRAPLQQPSFFAASFDAASSNNTQQIILHVDDVSYLDYMSLGTLRSGDSFGTYSCLLGEPRAATVVTQSYCELYSLRRADLEQVVAQWPELADEFQSLATAAHTIEDAAWDVREEMGLLSRKDLGLYVDESGENNVRTDGAPIDEQQARFDSAHDHPMDKYWGPPYSGKQDISSQRPQHRNSQEKVVLLASQVHSVPPARDEPVPEFMMPSMKLSKWQSLVSRPSLPSSSEQEKADSASGIVKGSETVVAVKDLGEPELAQEELKRPSTSVRGEASM